MSAKGRGRHEGGAEDYYPTPAWCVERLLEDCGDVLPIRDGAEWLEPTAGDGAVIRATHGWYGARGRRCELLPWFSAVELRTQAITAATATVTKMEGYDFRHVAPGWTAERFDVAIGNPPYAIAEPIIRECLRVSRVTAMLLRLGFLGSDERVDFFRTVGADPALRILPDRPSFDGVGTDSSTYAWFVWGSPEIRGVKMLGSTPLAVRKAQTPQGLRTSLRQRSLFADTKSR